MLIVTNLQVREITSCLTSTGGVGGGSTGRVNTINN